MNRPGFTEGELSRQRLLPGGGLPVVHLLVLNGGQVVSELGRRAWSNVTISRDYDGEVPVATAARLLAGHAHRTIASALAVGTATSRCSSEPATTSSTGSTRWWTRATYAPISVAGTGSACPRPSLPGRRSQRDV